MSEIDPLKEVAKMLTLASWPGNDVRNL